MAATEPVCRIWCEVVQVEADRIACRNDGERFELSDYAPQGMCPKASEAVAPVMFACRAGERSRKTASRPTRWIASAPKGT